NRASGLEAEPEFAAKPCPCVNPLPIGAACGDSQDCGRLLTRQSGEIAQFHELRLKRIVFRQAMQRRVQCQEVEVWRGCDQAVGVRASTLPAAAVLATLLAAGVVNQDAAHGLGGGGKEMPAVVPVRVAAAAQETQVGLVNQRRGLECLTGPLLGQL